MASISILITASPSDIAKVTSALSFCEHAAAQGKAIDQVFFYHDGVHHANALQYTPGDEKSMYGRWLALHNTYDVPLWVCITAATKRGIVSPTEAQEIGQAHYNLLPPFEQVGLGEFFTKLHESSNLVQF